jgi:hypothetical protein
MDNELRDIIIEDTNGNAFGAYTTNAPAERLKELEKESCMAYTLDEKVDWKEILTKEGYFFEEFNYNPTDTYMDFDSWFAEEFSHIEETYNDCDEDATKIALALKLLDTTILHIADCIEEDVEMYAESIGFEFDSSKKYKGGYVNDNMILKIYTLMARERTTSSILEDRISKYEERDFALFQQLAQSDTDDIYENDIIKAIYTIRGLVIDFKRDDLLEKIDAIKALLETVNLDVARLGYRLGTETPKYLDAAYFPNISNDGFTIGGINGECDVERNLGEYCFHIQNDLSKYYTIALNKENPNIVISFYETKRLDYKDKNGYWATSNTKIGSPIIVSEENKENLPQLVANQVNLFVKEN